MYTGTFCDDTCTHVQVEYNDTLLQVQIDTKEHMCT
jgi:hypothetical protein